MREELWERLHRQYPTLFSRPLAIECGDGWYGLLDRMLRSMEVHVISREKSRIWAEKNNSAGLPHADVPDPVDPITLQQIKEKFGTLRVYYQGGDDTIHGIARMAEAMSEITCEVCGSVGKTRNGTWIKTLCDQHHVKRSLGASDEFMD